MWKWSKAELYDDIEADGPIPVLAKTGRESVTSLKFSDEKILRRGIDATTSLDKVILHDTISPRRSHYDLA
ncbi:MAG: hypothetical protein RL292_428 [Candidatus Parcubacteria bacterium]|jgi:hypothetical protein